MRKLRFIDCAPEIFEATIPGALCHYTSNAGAVGIITSKSFWMGDISSLNDAKELIHAREILGVTVSNSISKIQKIDNFVNQHVRQQIWNGGISSGLGVCSFSEMQGSLDQWRAYGDDGQGICIWVRGDQLKASASSTGAVFGKCIYSEGIQEQICSRFVEKYLLNDFSSQEVVDAFSLAYEQPESPRQTSIIQMVSNFCQEIGIFFKHKSFTSELEWRCVSQNTGAYSQRCKFRATHNAIVPYDELSLELLFESHKTADRPLFGIALGPKNRHVPTSTSLQNLIYRATGKAYGISLSSIPYI